MERTDGTTRRARVARWAWVVLAVTVALTTPGCGGDGASAPSAPAFESALVRREGITASQARCVRIHVFAENPPEVLAALAEGGMQAIPMDRWNSYGHALLGCVARDELAVDGEAGG